MQTSHSINQHELDFVVYLPLRIFSSTWALSVALDFSCWGVNQGKTMVILKRLKGAISENNKKGAKYVHTKN